MDETNSSSINTDSINSNPTNSDQNSDLKTECIMDSIKEEATSATSQQKPPPLPHKSPKLVESFFFQKALELIQEGSSSTKFLTWFEDFQQSNKEGFKKLLEYRNDFGATLLCFASNLGNVEITTKLIESGAQINVQDNEGK